MTQEEIRALIADCKVAGLAIQVRADGQRQYLQVSDGKWTGRKWMLSAHMVPTEVASTALLAVLAWYEHEAREAFTYKGKAIYNPHVNLSELLERADNTEVREPPKESICRYCSFPIALLEHNFWCRKDGHESEKCYKFCYKNNDRYHEPNV